MNEIAVLIFGPVSPQNAFNGFSNNPRDYTAPSMPLAQFTNFQTKSHTPTCMQDCPA